jgi:hypothetical protein
MDTAPTTASVKAQDHREKWSDLSTDALRQAEKILSRKTSDSTPEQMVQSMMDEPSRINAAFQLGRRSIYKEVALELTERGG